MRQTLNLSAQLKEELIPRDEHELWTLATLLDMIDAETDEPEIVRVFFSRKRNAVNGVILTLPGQDGLFITTVAHPRMERVGPFDSMDAVEFFVEAHLGSDVMWDQRD